MKKLIALVGLLLLLLNACSDKEKIKKSGPVKVAGQIQNIPPQKFYLVASEKFYNYRFYAEAIDSVEVDANGQFHLQMDAVPDGGQYLKLVMGNGLPFAPFDMHVEAGDSLFIQGNWDPSNYQMQFSGDKAAYFNFYPALFNTFEKNPRWKKALRIRNKLSEDKFLSLMDSLIEKQREFHAHYHDSVEAPQNLRDLAAEHLIYKHSYNYYEYLLYHAYESEDSMRYYKEASPAFMKGLEALLERECKFHFLSDYHSFIDNHLNHLYMVADDKGTNVVGKKLELLKASFRDAHKPYAVSSLIYEYERALSQDSFFQSLRQLLSYVESEFGKAEFSELMKKYSQPYFSLEPGQPAPDLSLPDSTGTYHSLSEMEGKVVYLTFWGSWCPPCLGQIRQLQQLQSTFEEAEDVAFVQVAIEYGANDKIRWKKLISGGEVYSGAAFIDDSMAWRGLHLISAQGEAQAQIDDYKLQQPPVYVLINKDGEIADPRAPLPNLAAPAIEAIR